MKGRRGLSASSPIRVACIGGGQLGRMMALEAPRLGIQMSFLDPLGEDSPAAKVVPQQNIIQGSLMDVDKIRELAKGADVLTVEIEHVGVETFSPQNPDLIISLWEDNHRGIIPGLKVSDFQRQHRLNELNSDR